MLGPEDDDDGPTPDHYLLVGVGGEDYALPVQAVVQIMRAPRLIEVPDLPAHLPGVINLRGRVVPVMDLRLRFGLSARPYDERTLVVVLEHGGQPLALIVEAVLRVVDLHADDILPPPARGSGLREQLVRGLVTRAERVHIVVELDRLVGDARAAEAA